MREQTDQKKETGNQQPVWLEDTDIRHVKHHITAPTSTERTH